MRTIILFSMAISLVACSSAPRTKWTDPVMRVMVDGDGLEAKDYVRIVKALKSSGKFVVVDRRDGLRAIQTEQKMIHQDRADQFADHEKYSIWGRLYGVGGIVIGHVQCSVRHTLFGNEYPHCLQYLAVISANSGEVITAVEGENDEAEQYYGDIKIASDWQATTEKLEGEFPKEFTPEMYSQGMKDFRAEAKEEALRRKEINARELAAKQEVK